MKATMESTSKLLILNGLSVRVWEGVTQNGVRFVALVNRLQAVQPTEQQAMVQELTKFKEPSAETERTLIQMGVVAPPPESEVPPAAKA